MGKYLPQRYYISDFLQDIFGMSKEAAIAVTAIPAILVLGALIFFSFQAFRTTAKPETKRKFKRILIVFVAAALCAAGAWLLLSRGLPARRADQMLAAGDYDGAVVAYEKLDMTDRADHARIEKAKSLLEKSDLTGAADILSLLVSREEAAGLLLDNDALRAQVLAPGSALRFGVYPTKFGHQDVRWFVLDRQDGKTLLFADDFGCYEPYGENGPATWETSGARRLLNTGTDSVLHQLFTKAERAVIRQTEVKNNAVEKREGEKPKYREIEGKTTRDQLFLLSTEEIEQYGIHRNQTIWGFGSWWTRTMAPGDVDRYVYITKGWRDEPNRELYNLETVQKRAKHALRPAMWVDMNALLEVWATGKSTEMGKRK